MSLEEGQAFAKSIGALFTESSAKTNLGVQQAFEELVLQVSARARVCGESDAGAHLDHGNAGRVP